MNTKPRGASARLYPIRVPHILSTVPPSPGSYLLKHIQYTLYFTFYFIAQSLVHASFSTSSLGLSKPPHIARRNSIANSPYMLYSPTCGPVKRRHIRTFAEDAVVKQAAPRKSYRPANSPRVPSSQNWLWIDTYCVNEKQHSTQHRLVSRS